MFVYDQKSLLSRTDMHHTIRCDVRRYSSPISLHGCGRFVRWCCLCVQRSGVMQKTSLPKRFRRKQTQRNSMGGIRLGLFLNPNNDISFVDQMGS